MSKITSLVLPDGTEVEVPEGMTKQQVAEKLRAQGYKLPSRITDLPHDPTQGMSTGQLYAAGAGKALTDTGRGFQQLVNQSITNLGQQGNPLALGASFALGTGARTKELQQEEAEQRKLDAPLMQKPAALAGYASPAVASSLLGGPIFAPKTFGQAALSGATLGALQPATGNMDRVYNMLFGTGGSLLGQGVGAGIERVARPVRASKYAQQLLKEDIVPTPGQAVDPSTMAGRFARNLEERASSAPIVGEPIAIARERAVSELNKAALRRAGDVSGEIGQDAVAAQAQALGSQLDNLTAQVGTLQVPRNTIRSITDVTQGRMIAPGHLQTLKTQLGKLGTAAQNGAISGEDLAKLRSQWSSAQRAWANSSDGSQREAANALKSAIDNLDQFSESNMPRALSEAFKKAREQYRNLVIVETASSSAANRVNEPGVFTPNQLMTAVKQNAQGMKRKTVASGQATMQDLATPGMILKATRPDSGTTERAITAGLLTGGLLGTGYAGQEGYDYRIPLALGALTGGGYLARPMTKYLVGGLPGQQMIGNALANYLRPAASMAGGGSAPWWLTNRQEQ